MTEFIVVTSGKGGVGKTTSSASVAVGLAKRGKKIAVIDFDVGLRNLDLIMGCERRVVYDFVNVIHQECTLKQALIKDKRYDSLHVLAASQTRDKEALTKDGVERVLNELKDEGFDYVVCDSPAGIEKGAFLAMYFADRAIVVVNPEVSSVRDSDRILGLLSSKTRRAETGAEPVVQHLLLTRYNPTRVAAGDIMKAVAAHRADARQDHGILDVLRLDLLFHFGEQVGLVLRPQHQHAIELAAQDIGAGHLGIIGPRVFRRGGMALNLRGRRQRQQAKTGGKMNGRKLHGPSPFLGEANQKPF